MNQKSSNNQVLLSLDKVLYYGINKSIINYSFIVLKAYLSKRSEIKIYKYWKIGLHGAKELYRIR